MGSASWFRSDRIRSVAALVVADGPAWRSRLRTLLLGPVQDDESAQAVVCGMGVLIFVDPEAAGDTGEDPGEQIRALLPRQRAAAD